MAEANLYLEKRAHPRFSVKVPVQYYLAIEDEGKLEHIVEWRLQDKNGQTLDLSLDGMGFVVDQKLIMGSVIRLDMALPNQTEPLPIYAEVVWMNEKGAGLHFIEMMDEDVKKLKAYLDEVASQQNPA